MTLQDKKELKDVIRSVVGSISNSMKIEHKNIDTLINVIMPLVKPLLEIRLEERKWGKAQGRDYSKEKTYNNSPERRKYRAELNRENRKRGDYGNGDGKDLHHAGKGEFRKEPSSVNKGRKEKSRKKGYKK